MPRMNERYNEPIVKDLYNKFILQPSTYILFIEAKNLYMESTHI